MLKNTTRILFFGIYDFGSASLENLVSRGFNIIGVVTKPEQEGGKQAVVALARQNQIPHMAPTSPGSSEFIKAVQNLRPNLIVVAGYHKIIPKVVLDIPNLGAFNLHASLLPAYRGPCPWKWAIINGETHTGLTVHETTPQLDKGDILNQRSLVISDDDTGRTLFSKCCIKGAELLVETLEQLKHSPIERHRQNETIASYFSYPTEEDACISWHNDARTIRNLVRGLNPSPGAWTSYQGHRLVIDTAEIIASRGSGEPGRIIEIDDQKIVVGTLTGNLVIRQLHIKSETDTNIAYLQQYIGIRRGDYFDRSLTHE
jgi:methionyl-tRNA formyltransferase